MGTWFFSLSVHVHVYALLVELPGSFDRCYVCYVCQEKAFLPFFATHADAPKKWAAITNPHSGSLNSPDSDSYRGSYFQ